ncbi:MAG TPA: hypothetical protein PK680_03150 [Novosphingobium sp.]|nr:hypothetical protein [Novosphingobium sp.]HQA17362.1 hypothetical protein [Novosphingobium sp.]
MKLRLILPLAALTLGLAACNSESKTEAVPESTDFVVEDPTASAVPVDLPSTEMTMAPASEEAPAK